MLLTVWMYAYLRGVLSTRAVEDRCRYDATFRVACGREVPDHTTFSRFRKYLFAREGLAGELFCQVLRVCACAGLGRLSVVAGDGVKIAASASKEAGRTEAGLRKLAAQVIAGARKAAADEGAERDVAPGTDLPLGAESAPGPDPRSRAGRARACPDDLRGEREAAEAQAREQGKAYLQALAAGAVSGRPPAAVILAAARPRLEEAVAAEEAVLAGWQARKAAGQRVTRPPARPGTECVRFFVRGDFFLSVSGYLSGLFSSRYLMPWCLVCVRPLRNRAYHAVPGLMLRVPVIAASRSFRVPPPVLRGSHGGRALL